MNEYSLQLYFPTGVQHSDLVEADQLSFMHHATQYAKSPLFFFV